MYVFLIENGDIPASDVSSLKGTHDFFFKRLLLLLLPFSSPPVGDHPEISWVQNPHVYSEWFYNPVKKVGKFLQQNTNHIWRISKFSIFFSSSPRFLNFSNPRFGWVKRSSETMVETRTCDRDVFGTQELMGRLKELETAQKNEAPSFAPQETWGTTPGWCLFGWFIRRGC